MTEEFKIKTIQLTLAIGDNDLERKMKQAQKFLSKKEQVRVTVLLKGRQKDHPERASIFLNDKYEEFLKGHGTLARPATPANPSLTIMPLGSN